jgi:predicted acetyltransferase
LLGGSEAWRDFELALAVSLGGKDMSTTQLIKPSRLLEASHRSLIREFTERDEELVPWVLAEVCDDFEKYVSRLEQHSSGVDLRPGFVPSTTFWLIDVSKEILAVSNLRHELTPFLLDYGGHIGFGVRPSARRHGYATEIVRQTLVKARKLGIEDVLVTCDKDNIGSAKAIMNNGGELWDERYMREHSCTLQRYWIRR